MARSHDAPGIIPNPACRRLCRHRHNRRTCARLCHLAGGELDQIQFLLGHVSIQTTERYLGCKQRSVVGSRTALSGTPLRPLASARSATVTKELAAPSIRRSGVLLVDNLSAFRKDSTVPLVVPEVNPETLANHDGAIANSNCVAIILTVAVAPIHRAVGVRQVVVSTYQSASGAGLAAMEELSPRPRNPG